MNIWLVSIFENTPLDDNLNTRYNSIAKEASNRNHQVTFWSSTFRHNVKKQRILANNEVLISENIKVKFVEAKSYSNNISFSRMLSHFNLGKKMIKAFNNQPELPDVIVIAFPPISTAFEVVQWAKKKSIPAIIDIIDPWPDVFIQHMAGIKRSIVHLGVTPLQRKTAIAFRNSSAVMAISKQYIDWAKKYTTEQKKSAYFYPAVQFEEIKKQLEVAKTKRTKQNDILTVIYAGSLGFSYDLPTILKAAEILEKKQPQIQFIIAGDGPQKTIIEDYQSTHSNLKYLGRLSKEKLMEEYYVSDIGLTQHIKGATQSVTYKLFDLLACGLPIMNSLESEMKSIIVDHKVGFHNNPSDFEQLAKNILRCYEDKALLSAMKVNALQLTAEQGDSKTVYENALHFIEAQVV
ncbi:glycosyltransferase family 4 protein [Flavobacterium sp. j3]|jgi:glycosyltransferase involved in cell wall biosynthesis|uniref:Glycosyltransferase family 4 protein n=1 Tax=Flavobacterium aureirubrum TaxID=3133147 RepID=A0ABU9N595_9FLAO